MHHMLRFLSDLKNEAYFKRALAKLKESLNTSGFWDSADGTKGSSFQLPTQLLFIQEIFLYFYIKTSPVTNHECCIQYS